MDFHEKIQQLVRLLRGSETQKSLSAQLGYSYNIVGRWESGTNKVLWDDFLALATELEIPIEKILFDLCGLNFQDYKDSGLLVQFFRRGKMTDDRLEKYFSSQKILRLSRGDTRLSLEDFLILVELSWGRSQRFFDLLKPYTNSKSLVSHELGEYNNFVGNNPRSAIIRMALDLKGYKDLNQHSHKYLADICGLTDSQVKESLNAMLAIDAIRWEGKHFVSNLHCVDSAVGNSQEVSRKILTYWRNEISRHVASTNPGKSKQLKSAYLIYKTNEKLEKELFELSNHFYGDFKKLVTSYEDKQDEFTSIKIMTCEFFSISQPPDDLDQNKV